MVKTLSSNAGGSGSGPGWGTKIPDAKKVKKKKIIKKEIHFYCKTPGASLVAQMVNNPPAMQETWVQFLGREDLLEKEMATHSSILAWRIPWTEESGRLQSMGSKNRIRLND